MTKTTIGGTSSMTLMIEAYEPVKIESVFIIEKEGDFTDKELDDLQEKCNNRIKEDLLKKASEVLKSRREFKNRIKELTR